MQNKTLLSIFIINIIISSILTTIRLNMIEKDNYKVINVVDGDTLDIQSMRFNNIRRIRIIGINSPELSECGGKEAKEYLTELVLNKIVTIEKGNSQNKDKYGRYIRHVIIDTYNIGYLAIFDGYARAYTFKDQEYNTQEKFYYANNMAKEHKLGVYAICNKIN